MGTTVPDLLTWEPPKKTRTKRVKKASKRAATKPTT